jgi:hypothetical protein
MAIPNHYQQSFQTCNYRDTQEKVDTTGMQEITQSGVYVGTLSGGFLQDYQAKSDGTPGTLCQVTLVTDDNQMFSRFSFTFLKNGQYGKQGMAVLMLAQDPYGQKPELFPRITEGMKDGKPWYKLDDADGLRVAVVLFVNGTYTSSDGSVHPKTECLGIFDGKGHSAIENRSGRADTAALNSAKHWLRTKMEEAAAQGNYGYQQQAAPAQWQQQAQPSPTQALDMAVAAQQAAMAKAQQQRQQGQWSGFNAPRQQQGQPMPDPRNFAVPGQQQGFQDDPMPF